MLKQYINLKIFIIISLITLGKPLSLFSQTFADGKVINAQSREPVPFATILLKNNQLGVYANADGDFKILLNTEFTEDSIIVTCIGYKRYSQAYSQLTKKTNTILLEPIIYGLGEVKIRSSGKKLGSVAIIKRAIARMQLNYPTRPFTFISYYRDYQKHNSDYINLNEGIVQTQDNGFLDSSYRNTYRLLDFRKNTSFSRIPLNPYYEQLSSENPSSAEKVIPEATLGDQYGNELLVLAAHDAIRNYNVRSFSFIETFSEDFIANHNFSPPEVVYNDNLALYKIVFTGRTRIIGYKLAVKGAIYIEPKNYCIHKIEYTCSYGAEIKKPGEMFSADIEYGHTKDIDSLMCLKYISFNNYFKIVDMNDENFFRPLKAALDTALFINPTLIVEFNKKVDPVTGSKKENYVFMVRKKPVRISSAQVRDNLVYLRMKKEDYKKNMNEKYTVSVHDIKDISGNIVNRRNTLDVYQYRELFVQEYNKPLPLKDSCFIEYKPLEENCISTMTGKEKYWMNTPSQINK